MAFLVAVLPSFEPFITGRFGLAYLVAVLFADAIFILLHSSFRNPRQGSVGQVWNVGGTGGVLLEVCCYDR